MKKTATSGFTLIQMLVAVTLGAIAAYASTRVAIASFRAYQRYTQESMAFAQSRAVGNYLKLRLEGTRSFQGLGLRIPGTAWQAVGPGFLVFPGFGYFDDATGAQSDKLFIVNKIPSTQTVQLTNPIAARGFGNPITITVQGSAPLNTIFQPDSYLVMTNVQASEVYQITGAIPAGNNGVLTLSNAPTFATGAGLPMNAFSSGDLVFPAEISMIGYDTAARGIRAGARGQPNSQLLATGVQSFQVRYNLCEPPGVGACPNSCDTAGTDLVMTGPNFSRDDWVSLLWSDNNTCYRRILRIRVDITMDGPQGPKIMDYSFNTNL